MPSPFFAARRKFCNLFRRASISSISVDIFAVDSTTDSLSSNPFEEANAAPPMCPRSFCAPARCFRTGSTRIVFGTLRLNAIEADGDLVVRCFCVGTFAFSFSLVRVPARTPIDRSLRLLERFVFFCRALLFAAVFFCPRL